MASARRSIMGFTVAALVMVACSGGDDGREAAPTTTVAPATVEPRLRLVGHTARVLSAAFLPGGERVATGSSDGTAKIWDLATGSLLTTVEPDSGDEIWDLAVSPDGATIVTGGLHGDVVVWDAASGSQITSLEILDGEDEAPIFAPVISFSPDGTLLVTAGTDPEAEIWDTTTWTERYAVTGGGSAALWVAEWSGDGSLLLTAAGGVDGAIIHDGATGDLVATIGREAGSLRGNDRGEVPSVAFSPDDRRVATTATDGTTAVFDTATGDLVVEGTRPSVVGEPPARLEFYDDGTVLVINGTSELSSSPRWSAEHWDLLTGELTELLRYQRDSAVLAVGPNTSTIVSSRAGDDVAVILEDLGLAGPEELPDDIDLSVKIWDAATGALTHVLDGHTELVNTAVFGPDGTTLLTASHDGVVILWSI